MRLRKDIGNKLCEKIPDCDKHYFKLSYVNKNGTVYYMEIQKVSISDEHIFIEYILTRKSWKTYFIPRNTHIDRLKWLYKQYFKTTNKNVKLEVVTFKDVEDDMFLNNI